MFDTITTATALTAAWSDLELPPQVRALVDALAAGSAVQDPAPSVDVAAITAENIAATMANLADNLAHKAHFRDARIAVQESLAAHLLAVAGEAVDQLVDQLRPEFETASKTFTTAVLTLPEDLSPPSLIRGGPAVLQAFNDAQAAERELVRIDNTVASFQHLPRFIGVKVDPVLRLLTPKDRRELKLLLTAHNKTGELKPSWVAAAREHIVWQINTPTEAQVIRTAIDSTPLPQRPLQYARLGK